MGVLVLGRASTFCCSGGHRLTMGPYLEMGGTSCPYSLVHNHRTYNKDSGKKAFQDMGEESRNYSFTLLLACQVDHLESSCEVQLPMLRLKTGLLEAEFL